MHPDTAVPLQHDLPPDAGNDDAFVNADLLLSTHRTVVVRARIAGPLGRSVAREVGLVVARQHCVGDRPRRTALIDAAQRCADRVHVAPGQIQAQIDGRWQAVLAAASPQPQTPKGNPAMNTSTSFFRSQAVAACVGLLALAGTATAGTPQENYRQERANCMAGRTSQDRATCLREAGAALQESRRNGLATPTSEQQAMNAVQRCQRQPEAERADCVRLARGEGKAEGSVGEGAIVREIATLQTQPTGAGNTR